MRDAEVEDVLDKVIADLREVRRDWRRASRNNAEWSGLGHGQGGSLTGRVGGGGTSDPTGDTAQQAVDAKGELRADEMKREKAIAEALVETVRLGAYDLRRFCWAYTNTTSGKFAEPTCKSCLRVHASAVIYASGYCRWCYDMWRALGCEPHPDLVVMHVEKRKISAKTIQRFHPWYESTRTVVGTTPSPPPTSN